MKLAKHAIYVQERNICSLFFLRTSFFTTHMPHIKLHILKGPCVKVTVEKAVIVQTKEQCLLLEETFIDSHLCVCVCGACGCVCVCGD